MSRLTRINESTLHGSGVVRSALLTTLAHFAKAHTYLNPSTPAAIAAAAPTNRPISATREQTNRILFGMRPPTKEQPDARPLPGLVPENPWAHHQ
jgi:hypothetical protein